MVENAKIKKNSNATFWVIFKQCDFQEKENQTELEITYFNYETSIKRITIEDFFLVLIFVICNILSAPNLHHSAIKKTFFYTFWIKPKSPLLWVCLERTFYNTILWQICRRRTKVNFFVYNICVYFSVLRSIEKMKFVPVYRLKNWSSGNLKAKIVDEEKRTWK